MINTWRARLDRFNRLKEPRASYVAGPLRTCILMLHQELQDARACLQVLLIFARHLRLL
jgi:hypothetical protein